ncbi:MAG: hypothetical protein ACOX5R_10165 [bacterium]|jgi:hypothetical protein
MDYAQIERIVIEEVKKALAEMNREQASSLPPSQQETLDPNACRSGACTIPTETPKEPKQNPTPQVQPKQNPVSSAPTRPAGPTILTIFSGAREQWDLLAKGFQNWRREGISLDAVFSSSASEVISPQEIEQLGFRMIDRPAEIREIMHDMKRYTVLFLPSLSRTHAAKLALGITDNVTLNLSIAALAQKVPTYATTEGLSPTACMVCGNNVPGIQEVLDKYREQLARMGMKLCTTADAINEIHQVIFNKENSGPDLITTLITEEDAGKLKGPVVKVARGGLVTPLAWESFRMRGIEVVIVPQR